MFAAPWWAWIIVGGGFAWAELHYPRRYLMWIALAAVLTGGLAKAYDLGLGGDFVVFAGCAALSCAVGRIVYRATPRR